MKLEFSRPIFEKKAQISSFIKIRPVGAELFHADRQTNGQTDMAKLLVAFLKFANAPKKCDANGLKSAKGSGLKDRTVAQSFFTPTFPILHFLIMPCLI
jgi:hypothetical protein